MKLSGKIYFSYGNEESFLASKREQEMLQINSNSTQRNILKIQCNLIIDLQVFHLLPIRNISGTRKVCEPQKATGSALNQLKVY